MIDYEHLRILINNASTVNFSDFGDGVSDAAINFIDNKFGNVLPPSYKWWLKNYGGGEIGGEEIYSVYENLPEGVDAGDIFQMWSKSNDKTKILLCDSNVDGFFYFDTSVATDDGELPVFSHASNKIYAENFIDFLTKRIAVHER